MTYLELKRKILNLGFETDETYQEEPTIMIDAINSAMRYIANIAPIISKYQIAQYPLKNLLIGTSDTDAKHYNGLIPLVYSAENAKSLYFECSGQGELTITDDNGTRVIILDSLKAFKEYREFVKGKVNLSFAGNYSYDIKNIAVYGERFSDKIEDIPSYREYIRYNLKELTAVNNIPVFVDFVEIIKESNTTNDETYVNIKNFKIEQNCILVLDGMDKAEYSVFYKRNFILFTEETSDDFLIELDFEIENALPFLAAWYVFRDDEESKAVDWKNEAEDILARYAQKKNLTTVESAFINELGW